MIMEKKELLKNAVYGFKAFEIDENGIFCREKRYYPGKVNYQDGPVSPCCNGIHFCKSIFDVRNYYDIGSKKVVIYPVAAVGKVVTSGDKSVTNGLYIFNEPLADDVKYSFNRTASTYPLVFEYQGLSYKYPFNSCDKFFFNNHENERTTYGGFSIKFKDVEKFFEILHGMDYTDKSMMEFYFNKTEKFRTGEKFIDVYTNDKIIQVNDKFINNLLDRIPIKAGKRMIKKYSIFYEKLGLFKRSGSCDTWLYIDELNQF